MSQMTRGGWKAMRLRGAIVTLMCVAPLLGGKPSSALAQGDSTVPVKVIGMDGSEQSGLLSGMTENSVALVSDSGEQTEQPLELIARLEFGGGAGGDTATRKDLPLTIRLVDGSVVRASDVTIQGDAITATLAQGQLRAGRRDVDWIRFLPLSEVPAEQSAWREIIEAESTGDLVVVSREVDGARTLNAVEGVIGDLSGEGLGFKFDDQQIVVKRERLDSVRLFHPVGRRLAAIRGSVRTIAGDQLSVKSWESANGELRWTLVSGAEVISSLEALQLIDFEAGRVTHVGDLEPTTFDWTPFVSGGEANPEANERLKSLFAYEKDRAFDGGPLTLYSDSGFAGTGESVRAFSRGLALRSRTRLAYRVPEDHRRLVGWLGMDPLVRPRGDVTVVIEGDGKALWSGTLTGSDAEPINLDLDVENVSRLVILVDFGNGGDLGDRVHWCEPRFVK